VPEYSAPINRSHLSLNIDNDQGRFLFHGSQTIGGNALGANSVYRATKAALRSLARTWTVDLRDRHIRVNVVSPGFTDTPGLRQLLAARGAEQSLKGASDIIPLGRTGTPNGIAKPVVFLASEDSSYITGKELFVDGGLAQVQS
jgi:NAD(P)-dependent dehydrogenase (short-subunit alcohol dehydrogenase family)